MLAESQSRLATDYCSQIDNRQQTAGEGFLRPLLGVLLFHFLRYFPRFLVIADSPLSS